VVAFDTDSFRGSATPVKLGTDILPASGDQYVHFGVVQKPDGEPCRQRETFTKMPKLLYIYEIPDSVFPINQVSLAEVFVLAFLMARIGEACAKEFENSMLFLLHVFRYLN
jgi:hypothetical protein